MTSPTRLTTERLVLRPLEAGDAERLSTLANDKRIARNLTNAFPHPYSQDDAVAFIGSGGSDLAITSKDTVGELPAGLIGCMGSTSGNGENDDVHQFGYWLTHEAWGNGFATEAARAYLDHLIATQNPRRIEALVYAWNPASCHVLEKLGFEFEGRFRSRVRRFGDVTDELMYALVP
jgi:RimJ/RimL family protein N-acetyltransferase